MSNIGQVTAVNGKKQPWMLVGHTKTYELLGVIIIIISIDHVFLKLS